MTSGTFQFRWSPEMLRAVDRRSWELWAKSTRASVLDCRYWCRHSICWPSEFRNLEARPTLCLCCWCDVLAFDRAPVSERRKTRDKHQTNVQIKQLTYLLLVRLSRSANNLCPSRKSSKRFLIGSCPALFRWWLIHFVKVFCCTSWRSSVGGEREDETHYNRRWWDCTTETTLFNLIVCENLPTTTPGDIYEH